MATLLKSNGAQYLDGSTRGLSRSHPGCEEGGARCSDDGAEGTGSSGEDRSAASSGGRGRGADSVGETRTEHARERGLLAKGGRKDSRPPPEAGQRTGAEDRRARRPRTFAARLLRPLLPRPPKSASFSGAGPLALLRARSFRASTARSQSRERQAVKTARALTRLSRSPRPCARASAGARPSMVSDWLQLDDLGPARLLRRGLLLLPRLGLERDLLSSPRLALPLPCPLPHLPLLPLHTHTHT